MLLSQPHKVCHARTNNHNIVIFCLSRHFDKKRVWTELDGEVGEEGESQPEIEKRLPRKTGETESKTKHV